MSDLTATNCGSCSSTFGGGCNNSIILILLLFFFCGNNSSNGCGFGLFGGNNGCDGDCGCGNSRNNGCDWIIWIILLSCICGGNNNGCGC